MPLERARQNGQCLSFPGIFVPAARVGGVGVGWDELFFTLECVDVVKEA